MRLRTLAIAALAILVLSVATTTSPAQSKHVIHITMQSYKFEPNLFFVNEGETVVLQLENIDTQQRPHAFNSPVLSQVDFNVTGQYKEDVAKDGTKYVELEPGQKAEVTFVAKGRGQYSFVCNLYNHAARGQTGVFIVWPAGYHPPTQP